LILKLKIIYVIVMKEKKKFIEYCITCKKNLCIMCSEKHKDHVKKKFLKLDQLTKEKKKAIKK